MKGWKFVDDEVDVIHTASGWLRTKIKTSSTMECGFSKNAGPSAFLLEVTICIYSVVNCVKLRISEHPSYCSSRLQQPLSSTVAQRTNCICPPPKNTDVVQGPCTTSVFVCTISLHVYGSILGIAFY